QKQAPEMPAAVQKWLVEHPEFLSDAVAQAELNLATMKAVRAGKTWHDSDFIDTVERYLGLRQQAPTNGNGHDRATPMSAPTPAPRHSMPLGQQYSGPAVSAPPSRDPPSWSSGRPMNTRAPLTAAERD